MTVCTACNAKLPPKPNGASENAAPRYHAYTVPEMDDNPLIAVLPHITDVEKEQTKRLMLKPAFSEAERSLPSSIRILLLNRLKYNFYYPSPLHLKTYKSIEAQIVAGYWTRNPATPQGQAYVHGLNDEKNKSLYRGLQDIQPASIAMLLALSGSGKSALLDAIARAMGPSVIVHTRFRDSGILMDAQIVTLKRNMTDQPNAMVKGISKVFADRVDEVLGSAEYGPMFMDKSMTRTHYVSEFRRILRTHWVGIVIIDAFEHISLAGTKGTKELLNVLDNLRDELGVPVLLSSTYECSSILTMPSLRTTRRLIDGGVYELTRPDSHEHEDFDTFCEVMWKYQWLRKPGERSDTIKELLYEYSQGIPAILLLLFRFSQEYAIQEKIETINEEILQKVYTTRFAPLHGALAALKAGNVKAYDDLYFKTMKDMDPSDPVDRMRQMAAVGTISSQADPVTSDTNATQAGGSNEVMKLAMGISQL